MQIDLYACTVHGLPNVIEAEINDFLQLSFIDRCYVLNYGFCFSLYINLNTCFVDYGLLNHGTFLTEDEQAFNTTLKLSSCRRYLTGFFLRHHKEELRIVAVHTILHEVLRWSEGCPQTRSKLFIIRTQHLNKVSLMQALTRLLLR